MRWLTLAGLASGVFGAILLALYPFEAIKGWWGEVGEGRMVREYPDGKPPLWRQLARQPLPLKVGFWLIVLGALLATAGTVFGL